MAFFSLNCAYNDITCKIMHSESEKLFAVRLTLDEWHWDMN